MDTTILKHIISSVKELSNDRKCNISYKNFDKSKLHVFICDTKIGTIDISKINPTDIIKNAPKWTDMIDNFINTHKNFKCKNPSHNIRSSAPEPGSVSSPPPPSSSLLPAPSDPLPPQSNQIDISHYGTTSLVDKVKGDYDGEKCLITKTCNIMIWNNNLSKWIPCKPNIPYYFYDIQNKNILNIIKYKNQVQALPFGGGELTEIVDRFTRLIYKAVDGKWLIDDDRVLRGVMVSDAPKDAPTDTPLNPPTDTPPNPPTDTPLNLPTDVPTDIPPSPIIIPLTPEPQLSRTPKSKPKKPLRVSSKIAVINDTGHEHMVDFDDIINVIEGTL